MIGYKAFFKTSDPNKFETSGGFIYEIDKVYETTNPLEFRKEGFHYCDFPLDVDRFYYNCSNKPNMSEVVYALVHILGDVKHDKISHNSITNKIRIIKLITRAEFFNMYADGKHISAYGDIFYIKNKKLYNPDNQPAIIRNDGTKEWFYV
jgi:hypothetical protein